MGKMMMRKPVLALMFCTVMAPLVLYTDRLGSFSTWPSKNEFIEDASTSIFNTGDGEQLNLIHQESSVSLKEPAGEVYTHKSGDSDASIIESQSGGASDILNTKEHKSRVLYMTNDGAQSKKENPIRQVTDTVQKETNGRLMEMQYQSNGTKKKESKAQQEVLKKSQPVQTSNDASEKKVNQEDLIGQEKDQGSPSDAWVRQLKDQLIRGKVYLSLSATRSNPHFIRELRLRMKEVQRVIADATKDSDLPRGAHDKLKAMEQTLAKGRQIQDDCAAVTKKLRAMLHSTEEQLGVHKKQTMFLTQLTAKTVPKGLHCLPLRLTTEYYTLNSSQREFPNQDRLENPKLFHYALFSDNILATAVVVNSTISNAKHPSQHVFHIVTNKLNYAAMRLWFLTNPPGKATIQVQNVDEFTWLNASYSPVLKQLSSPSMIDYYFKAHHASSDSNLKFRNPKYLSILNHLRFYLPEIFPKLNKVVFLDDDLVVQKDISGLWSVDLKGNVNGAVETCGENFHRFDKYLNFSNPLIASNFDPRACGWAYGMNIFDLDQWKKQNITEVYHKWQKLNHDRQLWKLGTLPPGLITFWKQTQPIDGFWHVLGLGYNPSVNQRDIERAAVVHYNGNMKPWLEIGIPKYRNIWAKFVNYDHPYLRECNINP
uniref:Hexosyltransferase n=1 Tax=Kalanchoe fedtschenkoi TaxID=63787 RepID=A0A7N0UIB4_KALFE